MAGAGRDPEVDEFERKQQLRKNRRRPIQETLNELGEGRGLWKEMHRCGIPKKTDRVLQVFTVQDTRNDGERESGRNMGLMYLVVQREVTKKYKKTL